LHDFLYSILARVSPVNPFNNLHSEVQGVVVAEAGDAEPYSRFRRWSKLLKSHGQHISRLKPVEKMKQSFSQLVMTPTIRLYLFFGPFSDCGGEAITLPGTVTM
jgi:hypothetical protein